MFFPRTDSGIHHETPKSVNYFSSKKRGFLRVHELEFQHNFARGFQRFDVYDRILQSETVFGKPIGHSKW
jgi:hypothetical protein